MYIYYNRAIGSVLVATGIQKKKKKKKKVWKTLTEISKLWMMLASRHDSRLCKSPKT